MSKFRLKNFNRNFDILRRNFEILCRHFDIISRNFKIFNQNCELLSRNFELLRQNFDLLCGKFEIVSRNFEIPINRNKSICGPHALSYLHVLSLFRTIFSDGLIAISLSNGKHCGSGKLKGHHPGICGQQRP